MTINLTNEELEFLADLYQRIRSEKENISPATFEHFINKYIEKKIEWLLQFHSRKSNALQRNKSEQV